MWQHVSTDFVLAGDSLQPSKYCGYRGIGLLALHATSQNMRYPSSIDQYLMSKITLRVSPSMWEIMSLMCSGPSCSLYNVVGSESSERAHFNLPNPFASNPKFPPYRL